MKWACCNVGAESPEECGYYFAWGETRRKTNYTELNCKTWGKNIGDISGNAAYDAATANWGGSWRMPTRAEIQELIDNCTWTWTTQNSMNGYKVTSKKNGNSIFLTAAGYRGDSSLRDAGYNGYYLSSTPYEDTYYAYGLYFNSGGNYCNSNGLARCFGFSVRPVSQ